MNRILFAEDELVLGRLVKEALEREPDFEIDWVKNGIEATKSFAEKKHHLIILDVMMPAMDGYATAKQIRQSSPDVPILFLTARSQTADVLKGYDSGGNDYIRKPFSVEELVVRIRELLRRTSGTFAKQDVATDVHQLGGYTFSAITQTLKHGDTAYQLSNKESILLEQLVLHKNNLMERKKALLQIWGDDNFFNSRNMDVYIARLRKYLVHDKHISIVNVRGYGYKLIEER